MKILSNETRWAGRTYRHAAPDGEGGGGGAGDGAGDGDGGAGDGEAGSGDAGAGDGGDGGAGDGDAGGDGDGGGDAGAGDDWRGRYLGHIPEGDEREAAEKLVGRFTSEEDFVQGAVQAHAKLRAGEISSGLPENPTDEQLADYRAANGIPEAADKYDLGPVEANRELSDVDREMLGPVMEAAHEMNINNDQLTTLMDKWMGETDKLVERMAQQDNLDMQEFTKVAKENWGSDYQINMNRITNQINMLPEAIRDAFKQAKMPDGRGIMASPEVMQWIVGMDRQITPLDPMQGGTESNINDARKIVDAAKTRMRDDREGWFKDLDAQKEFQQAQDMIDKFEGSQ